MAGSVRKGSHTYSGFYYDDYYAVVHKLPHTFPIVHYYIR